MPSHARSALRDLSFVVVTAALAGCPGGDFFGGAVPVPPNQPIDFGPTVSQRRAPPPISGGTLIVLRDGRTAVAADPDRDLVDVVDIGSYRVRAAISLDEGDEPGRLVEDGAGRVHVALRGVGALVTIDPVAGTIVDRRAVCAVARGVAYEARGDRLHVACADGRLVTLPAAGGAPTRDLALDRDLRDVIVDGDRLLVSRFKSAELLVLDERGRVERRLRPGGFRRDNVRADGGFDPAVAWRTVQYPGGGALMVHQRGFTGTIPVDTDTRPVEGGGGGEGGYGSGGGFNCGSPIVHTSITRLGAGGAQIAASPFLPQAVLPVDMAMSPDHTMLAIVAAGNHRLPNVPSVILVPVTEFDGQDEGCLPVGQGGNVTGQATAVAYTPSGQLVVQTREPPALWVNGYALPLPGESREDTGHTVFHSNSGADIACASCHVEGGEDGRTWTFSNSGPRRTQSVRGGILGTEPFHWDGDMPSLGVLFDQVFVHRMSGPQLQAEQLQAVAGWVDRIPLLPSLPVVDAAAVERGRVLFNDPVVGCATCHQGSTLTNNKSVDVGTGGNFQVPSLRGIAWRAPFIHTGCAATLEDRFGSCGGNAHGATAQLDDGQLRDLVRYLETL